MKLEVRCCCDPGKLIGTFVLRPASCVRVGDDALHLQFGERLEFDVLEALIPIEGELTAVHGRERRVAIRNRDYPLEKLRLVPGFEEAAIDAHDREAVTGHGRY